MTSDWPQPVIPALLRRLHEQQKPLRTPVPATRAFRVASRRPAISLATRTHSPSPSQRIRLRPWPSQLSAGQVAIPFQYALKAKSNYTRRLSSPSHLLAPYVNASTTLRISLHHTCMTARQWRPCRQHLFLTVTIPQRRMQAQITVLPGSRLSMGGTLCRTVVTVRTPRHEVPTALSR